MRDERLRERAAVAGLQDRGLDLDEPFAVEVGADRSDHPRADDRVAPRVLVHEQVEVSLAVAHLRIGDAVERVRQRAADLAEEDELVDGDRRLAAACLRRPAGYADDVPQVDVDVTGPRGVAEELDAPAAIDEVEEDELPQLATSEDAAGNANLGVGLLSCLHPLGLRAHLRERDGVRKPLRRHA
jgi:hypothetical protein